MDNKVFFTFRCPVHQSPGSIAHSFNYEPYVSLKIDGIFQEVSVSEYEMYYPVFPPTWTKIEGEYYQKDTHPPILYVFYIESSEKQFSNVEEMYHEIETYFIKHIIDSDIVVDFEPKPTIANDMVHNINESYMWRDVDPRDLRKPKGLLWFPKKYWKLNTMNWNTYIEQLDDLFHFVTSNVTSLISHDGLVISTNVSSLTKNLIKLKPKEELTIDLFFNGRSFFSKERTNYFDIIVTFKPSEYEYGAVYRLAPTNNNKFVPVYKREKGKKPNPDYIISDILYKCNNYFEIGQLKDLYDVPWHNDIIPSGPVFDYIQRIYHSVLAQMNGGSVLEIGCGSMDQYHKHFMSKATTQYVGIDIYLAKLYEAQVKVRYDTRFKFVLGDITCPFNKWNERFPNEIWNTYFYNMVNPNQTFDNIISIFSSQYANSTPETWSTYVGEINARAKPGTRLFFMWIDSSKIKGSSSFYSFDSEKNSLQVTLPHKKAYSEPGLGTFLKDFIGSNTKPLSPKTKWVMDHTIHIDVPERNDELSISEYIKLINWIVLVKV
jgi:SAM-dependent methyltransferase